MAKPLLAGNWKMHGTAQTAAKLAADLATYSGKKPKIIVFPPYVCIPAVVNELAASQNIAVGHKILAIIQRAPTPVKYRVKCFTILVVLMY